MVRRLRFLMVMCVTLAACDGGGDGDGDDLDGPAIDAGDEVDAEVVDASPFPALQGDEYFFPEDLPREGCQPGTLAELFVEKYAVYHLDTEFDYGGGFVEEWNGALRLENGFGGVSAALNGGVTADVRLSEDDLFVRRVTTGASGHLRINVLDACAMDASGVLSGPIVQCAAEWAAQGGPACYVGKFRAVRLERLPEAPAQGLSLLGEFRGGAGDPWGAGIAVNVRVDGDLAYVARQQDGLRIVDVSDPANMKAVGRWARAGGYNDLKLVRRAGDDKRFVLATRDYAGVDVIDVSDPTQPAAVAHIMAEDGYAAAHTLFVETRAGATRLYLPGGAGGERLEVWDVTDPTAAVLLGTYTIPMVEELGGYIHDLSIQDGVAYLNYWHRGFVVVDMNDPMAPVEVGSFADYERRRSHSNWVTTVNGCKVAVHGDEDFTAHLRVIGVDPAPACASQLMQVLGELSLRPEVSIHNIMAFGSTAYVAWYQDGVRLVDLSNPAAPAVTRWFNTWEGFPASSFFEGAIGIDVDLASGKIYVADVPRGLLVLSIDP